MHLFNQITSSCVTFWIAVISFLMSLGTWIRTLITQRVNLRMKIIEGYPDRIGKSETVYFFLLIENLSRLPISISSVRLEFAGESIPCEAIPQFAYKSSFNVGERILEDHVVYTSGMPIQLEALGAVRSLIHFSRLPRPFPPDATHASLEVCTNRGKIKKLSLKLDEGWADRYKTQ